MNEIGHLVGVIDLDLQGSMSEPSGIVCRRAAHVHGHLAERLTNLGTLPMSMSSAEFTEFVRREVEDTARVLKAAGIKPQ